MEIMFTTILIMVQIIFIIHVSISTLKNPSKLLIFYIIIFTACATINIIRLIDLI